MSLPKFIVNINTNNIFELIERDIPVPHQSKQLRKQQTYIKIKHDGSYAIPNVIHLKIYHKNNAKGYFINCDFIEAALFHQARLRYEKSTELKTKNELMVVMEQLLEEFPEYLV